MADKIQKVNPPLSNFYKSKWFKYPDSLLNTPRYFGSDGADKTLSVPFVRLNHGTSAPALSLTKAGDLWYDQTTHSLKYYDLNQGAWVTLADADNSVSSSGDVNVSGVKQFVSDVKMAAGSVSGGNVQFNLGAGTTNALKAKAAAGSLKEAVDSANGHNPPAVAATSTFTFDSTGFDDINGVEMQLQSHDGTTLRSERFRLKNDGTAVIAASNHHATADFIFTTTAVADSTLTLQSADETSKTIQSRIADNRTFDV